MIEVLILEIDDSLAGGQRSTIYLSLAGGRPFCCFQEWNAGSKVQTIAGLNDEYSNDNSY